MDLMTRLNQIVYQTHLNQAREMVSAGNKNTLIKRVASAKLVEATLLVLWDELIHHFYKWLTFYKERLCQLPS